MAEMRKRQKTPTESDSPPAKGAVGRSSKTWVNVALGVVLVLVLLIAAVLVTKVVAPNAFFKIQGGWILYALTGGTMPPYFNTEVFQPEYFKDFIKDGDVIVSTGAKCGTNWMLYIVHLIRTKGDEKKPWTEINHNTPWISFRHFPGQTWPQLRKAMETAILPDGSRLKEKWDDPEYPFRVFKAHEVPHQTYQGKEVGCLHIREFPKVKFIAMTRNGKDVAVSLNTFWDSHADDFKKMWGGFPVSGESLLETVKSMSGGPLMDIYFNYVNYWWPFRNEPNVLFLHYHDLILDLRGNVAKIAEFVGVKLTDKEMDEVAHRASFAQMKGLHAHFAIQMFDHPEGMAVMKPEEEGGQFFKRGRSGAGKEKFDDQCHKVFDDAVDKYFGNNEEMKSFALHGKAGP